MALHERLERIKIAGFDIGGAVLGGALPPGAQPKRGESLAQAKTLGLLLDFSFPSL